MLLALFDGASAQTGIKVHRYLGQLRNHSFKTYLWLRYVIMSTCVIIKSKSYYGGLGDRPEETITLGGRIDEENTYVKVSLSLPIQ